MAAAPDAELGALLPQAALLAVDAVDAVDAEACHDEGASLLAGEGARTAQAPGSSQTWRKQLRTATGAVLVAGLLALAAVACARGDLSALRFRPGRMELQGKQLLANYQGAAATQCATGPLPNLWSPSAEQPAMDLRVLSYNLFWWNLFDKVKPPQMQFHLRTPGNGATQLLASATRAEHYDVMGFQECSDGPWLLSKAGLSGQYSIFRDKHCCMAYRTATWALLGRGVAWVAHDRKYGPRPAQWMRLRHVATNRVLFFVNHHGPLPINSGGVCGGASVAYKILQLIATEAQAGDAVVVVGDFNSQGSSVTIQHLETRLHKAFSGVADGGIDHIFSNLGPGSLVGAKNLGGGGSDHDAISAALHVQGGGPAVEAPYSLSPPPVAAATGGAGEFPAEPAAVSPQADGSMASRLRFLLRSPLAWLRK